MSSGRFEIDINKFVGELNATMDDVERGVEVGINDVMDDWRREAVNIAPKRDGQLRRDINTDVEYRGDNVTGVITANSTQVSKTYGRFNYAYWLHEIKKDIANPTTPGTVAEFLTETGKRNEQRWYYLLEQAVREQIGGRL